LALQLMPGARSAPIALQIEESKWPSSTRQIWRLMIKNVSDGPVVICLDNGSSRARIVRAAPGGRYPMTAWPSVYRPLFIASIIQASGTPTTRGREHANSLTDLSFESALLGLVMEPGDALTLPETTMMAIPQSATAKIAIHDGTWRQLDLVWDREDE
jgi:hypothetical protein